MKKRALIIFVKNILLGKVKTRLAKTVGDYGAFEVYKYLVDRTEKETIELEGVDLKVYFSDTIIESKWGGHEKFVQEGADLGDRMLAAFQKCFSDGYEEVIIIGSDLPDIESNSITEAFELLSGQDAVIGPARDGGYYLFGMNKLIEPSFKNKSWSSENLLEETQTELEELGYNFSLLEELNDIDTIEDLNESSIASKFEHLNELSRRNESTL